MTTKTRKEEEKKTQYKGKDGKEEELNEKRGMQAK